jgi:hypothetical protein
LVDRNDDGDNQQDGKQAADQQPRGFRAVVLVVVILVVLVVFVARPRIAAGPSGEHRSSADVLVFLRTGIAGRRGRCGRFSGGLIGGLRPVLVVIVVRPEADLRGSTVFPVFRPRLVHRCGSRMVVVVEELRR